MSQDATDTVHDVMAVCAEGDRDGVMGGAGEQHCRDGDVVGVKTPDELLAHLGQELRHRRLPSGDVRYRLEQLARGGTLVDDRVGACDPCAERKRGTGVG